MEIHVEIVKLWTFKVGQYQVKILPASKDRESLSRSTSFNSIAQLHTASYRRTHTPLLVLVSCAVDLELITCDCEIMIWNLFVIVFSDVGTIFNKAILQNIYFSFYFRHDPLFCSFLIIRNLKYFQDGIFQMFDFYNAHGYFLFQCNLCLIVSHRFSLQTFKFLVFP